MQKNCNNYKINDVPGKVIFFLDMRENSGYGSLNLYAEGKKFTLLDQLTTQVEMPSWKVLLE